MRKRLLTITVLALGLTAQADQRPNILFIFLDDFGWRDTAYMGSDFYETPNIDRLAKGGMVFTDAYSCSANCAPARACLLSGQYTPRHEIFNVGTKPRGLAKHRRLEHIAGTKTLRPDIVTWAESLQQAGYRTGMFGKWHLGTTPGEQGFDVEEEHTKLPGFRGHFGPNGQYLADVLTDRTIKFIEGSKGKPWCAYLAHYAVHTPIQAKRKIITKYEAKRPGKLHQHATMAAMIQSVDEGVGKIIAKLDQLGQRDNTVIFFFSDNGGYGPATDMAPLWGYKGNYYEGGIRVPFFVNWPGTVKAGQSTAEPIIGVDIYPTFLDLAKAKRPDQPMDGRSILPVIKGRAESVGPRPLFWHFPAYLQAYKVIGEQRDPLFRTRPCSAVRLGDWKLHEYFEDGALELYNLKDDIGERRNLAKVNPAKAKELHKLLVGWRKETGAPVPTKPNPDFDAAAEAAAIRKALARRGE
ncbi:MAG: aryl-sulfate sulfohydrolase [Verrucomicrobia bacterium]|nr:MAG: aryl-sulfate sulfohydrolase [Verrucomicrobiota bacterium]